MVARLILSLLLAAFALPAMAVSPCHDAPAPMEGPMAGMPTHSMPATPAREDKAVVAHACIGCIPPSSLESGLDLAPALRPVEIAVARIASFRPRGTSSPATPPPRQAA